MVTVAVPVYNGARYLDEVLAAVRAQRVDRELELLVVDSGSTDGSLEIAARHGARIHSIPKSEFSHGGTRNLAMELARGEHVAFITQDATPAHDGWLAALLEGFERAEDVALVFGPHDPRPDASHMIKAEMERHFATWGDGGREVDVQRLGRSAAEVAAYRAFPGRLTFFSDVNGCVAKWAWRQVPYRTVPYAEDQLLGREMIEAGFAKVFHPDARVQHSHDYPPGQFLRRYFDEFRSLREVLDHVEVAHPVYTPMTIRGLVGHDKRWLRRQGVSGRALVRPLAVSARHHAIRQTGAIVGTRADRVPRPLRKLLSLEGRDSFTPFPVPESPLLAQTTQPDARPARFDHRVGVGPRPARVSAARGRHGAPRRGRRRAVADRLGGAAVADRLRRAHDDLPADPPDGAARPPLRDPRVRPVQAQHARAAVLRAEIREHFVPIDAEVFIGLEDFDSADVAIATEWNTAFPVRDLPNCREKAYLVQDHEPEFFATSAAVDLGRGDLPDGLPLHRLHPVDGRHPARPLRARGALVRVRHRPRRVRVRGRGGPARGADRRLRAARDRAPRRRPRDGGPRRAGRPPARDPPRAVRLAQQQGRRSRSRPRTSASRRRGGSPSSTARRAWGSCSRSPPTRWWRTR